MKSGSTVAWTIKFTEKADKEMRKLDKPVSARILTALGEVSRLDDPRLRGKALTGNFSGLWRYRIGDWRVVCDLIDGELVVLVVEVAHRRNAYRI